MTLETYIGFMIVLFLIFFLLLSINDKLRNILEELRKK